MPQPDFEQPKKGEEIMDIHQDTIPVVPLEIIQGNILNYPTILGGTIRGGQAIFGSGNNCLKFDDKNGIWLGNSDFALAPFSVSMSGIITASNLTLTGGTIKYGKTSFTDSTNAGYFISSLGVYFGAAADVSKLKYTISSGAFDFIGTISSRSTAILALAIDSAGHFIDAALNTSAKTILGDFTFGESGAIKMITDADNGLWISPTGILGKKTGATTFSIDNAGNATFSGTLSAASGTFGTITGGTITGTSIYGNIFFAAGDQLFSSSDASVNLNGAGTGWLKRKDILVKKGGTYRIKFTLQFGTAGGTEQYGKIYKSGVAVGTLRTITTGTIEYSEDISGFSAGDNIQVYTSIKTDQAGTTPTITNFRIYVDNFDGATVVA